LRSREWVSDYGEPEIFVEDVPSFRVPIKVLFFSQDVFVRPALHKHGVGVADLIEVNPSLPTAVYIATTQFSQEHPTKGIRAHNVITPFHHRFVFFLERFDDPGKLVGKTLRIKDGKQGWLFGDGLG
jgi:hypothetical protein